MAKELNRFRKHTMYPTPIDKGHVEVCPHCHNVKYRHTWYAPDSKAGLLSGFKRNEIERRICPACDMEKRGTYGAEVLVHDVPHRYRFQVEWLIENEARNGLYNDPQNRLLEVAETLDGYEVHMVSPKLAQAIGKRIRENFKTSEIVTKYKPEPFPVYKTDVHVRVAEHFNYIPR